MSVLQHRAQPAIVTLPDRIDKTNAESVYEQLRFACAPGKTVVADFTATRFCDSTGILNLARIHQHAQTLDGQLWLAVPAGVVHRVVELLGLDELMPTYPTLTAAMTGDVAAGGGLSAGRLLPGL